MGCSFTCSSLAVGLVPSATSRTRLSPACSAAIWRSRQDGQSVERVQPDGKGGCWLALRLAFRSFRLVHVAAEMSRWLHDERQKGAAGEHPYESVQVGVGVKNPSYAARG